MTARYQRGLKPFDPEKHARFKTAAAYGFALPTPTYPIDKTGGIIDYGMDGNGPDKSLTVNGGQPMGNCVIEGTRVQASRPLAGYRAFYSGPVVRLTTESGKRLTVTPNHAVLTPRGFIRARLLKQGDHLIGADRLESGDRATDFDFDKPPAGVEEVFTALSSVVSPMAVPVDFHGDERFVHGDVDVVTTDRLLWGEPDALLCQPEAQQESEPTAQSKSPFHRLRSSFQRAKVRRTPALSGVSSRHDGLPVSRSHPGVHHAQVLSDGPRLDTSLDEQPGELLGVNMKLPSQELGRFTLAIPLDRPRPFTLPCLVSSSDAEGLGFFDRPKAYASATQPVSDGLSTDPELPGDLTRRFPGLITPDRVIDIERHLWNGHVYDLSTESNWYSANGIVVHNCGPCGVPAHADMITAALTGQSVPLNSMTANQVAALYFTYQAELAGIAWRPPTSGDWVPPAGLDNGVDLGDWLLWLFKNRYIEGFLKLQLDEADAALALFDVVVGGWILTDSTDDDFFNGTIAYVGPGNEPDPADGHCMLVTYVQTPHGLSKTGTWGGTLQISGSYRDACLQQVFAVLTHQQAVAVNFPFAALEADLHELGGTVASSPPASPASAPGPTVEPPAKRRPTRHWWDWLFRRPMALTKTPVVRGFQ